MTIAEPPIVATDLACASNEGAVGLALGGVARSTRSALIVVYAGYCVRYLSLIILIPYYGRVLGITEYGKVLTAMSLMGVIWMLVNYGFSPVGSRNVAGVGDRKKVAAEIGRHIHARLRLLGLALPIGAAAIVASPVLRVEPALGVLAIVIGVLSAFNLGWYFQGTQQFTRSILLEVAVFVVNVVLVLCLVKRQSDGIYVLVSLAVANAVVLVVAYATVLRQLNGRWPRLCGAGSLVRESTSLFLLGVVPTITLIASSYLLSLIVGAQHGAEQAALDVGKFGSAERLATALLAMLGPAHQVMLGIVSARIKIGNGDAAYALMRKGVLWLTGFGLAATIGTLLTAPLVVRIVFGPGFEASAQVLQLLAIGFPFAAFVQATSVYILVPLCREHSAVRVTLACTAVQLVLLVALAGPLAGVGAAIARSAADVLGAVALGVLLWKMGALRRVFLGPTGGAST